MKNVLIADASKSFRNTMRVLLEKSGLNVSFEAEDGRTALEKYKELRPDLVILDIDLPVEDGIQTLKSIKQVNANALVVIITSNDDTECIRMASYLGAKAYLLKSFSKERITETITNLKGLN